MKTFQYFNVGADFNFDQLKSQYRELIRRWHPDRNHDEDTTTQMQDVNSEYERLVQYLTSESVWTAQHDESQPWEQKRTDGFRDIAERIRKTLMTTLAIDPKIECEVSGTWIWVEGITREDKPIHAQLKGLGYKFHGKRGQWYWAGLPSRSRGQYSKEATRAKYGSQKFKSRQDNDETLKKR